MQNKNNIRYDACSKHDVNKQTSKAFQSIKELLHERKTEQVGVMWEMSKNSVGNICTLAETVSLMLGSKLCEHGMKTISDLNLAVTPVLPVPQKQTLPAARADMNEFERDSAKQQQTLIYSVHV